jgi:Fur family transcriptional regulator, stress-responsive regulator
METREPEAVLQQAALRVTPARVAVLRTLAEHPHADPATVLQVTRGREARVSVQGLYDVLATLTGAGVLRRIQPANAVARYELDRGDNHHHVVCRGCQALADVPCPVGSRPCLDPAVPASLGFTVDEAEVIYRGLCPSCQSAPAPGVASSQPRVDRSTRTPQMKEMA